jgi:hypothetical protein
MTRDITVLENIVSEIQVALFQKWANELPEDQRNEEILPSLAKNASDTTVFIIQMYMDKINQAVEELKDV